MAPGLVSLLRRAAALLLALAALPATSLAAPAPFDLGGPSLRISVTRAGKTLPIAQTPNLAEGDSLTIRAELPPNQAAHYLLVAAFLRGVTNPPPAAWFSQSRTWDAKDKAGLTVTVPQGAQQMLVFLAPETGGDFHTLVGAVRGRPGAFVRASQDLNQASLDHTRLQAFFAAVQAINQSDPGELKTASPLLARSLAIKLDSACLDKTEDLQASCLTQGRDSLVLDDGHSTSMVQALSSGYSAELIQQLSAAPQAGGGYFSPYVASVLDMAKLMESFHTAQYQYIPALGVAEGDKLALLLNAPPSFQNPKSVLVVALPAIEPALPPPLHAADPEAAACLEKPGLVLPAEGAPLVFAGAYAHDLTLRITGKDGHAVDLSLTADPAAGGLKLAAGPMDSSAFGNEVLGKVRGYWGFDPYEGPQFRLQNAHAQTWTTAPDDDQVLTAGRDSTVRLQAQASGCVRDVALQTGSDPPRSATWRAAGPDAILVAAPLQDVAPGKVSLLVHSYGSAEAEVVPAVVYKATTKLESFAFHVGDAAGVLKGADLDNVQSLEMDGVAFKPDPTIFGDGGLAMVADPAAAAKIKAGWHGRARLKLMDGRSASLDTTVGAPRPAISLIDKSVQAPAPDERIHIELKDPEELPRDAVLTFSIKAEGQTAFTGAETIEVRTAQGDFSARLTAANGGFVLQNAQVALASLNLGQAFGASAFGPLRFRLLTPEGASDWKPLGVLVRLPALQDIACPPGPEKPCQLSGSNLFLIQSVSAEPGAQGAMRVPVGFAGNTLQTPAPKKRQLYVRLGDDPAVDNLIVVTPRKERKAQ